MSDLQRTLIKDEKSLFLGNWKRVLDQSEAPFSEFQSWMEKTTSNKELVRTAQNTPLTLLAAVPENTAIFCRLDTIHQLKSTKFKKPLKELNQAISEKQWKTIDWDWEFTILNSPELNHYLKKTVSAKYSDSSYLNFMKKLDIIELGYYLYLSHKISGEQLILLYLLKHFHHCCYHSTQETDTAHKKNVDCPIKYPDRPNEVTVESMMPYYFSSKYHHYLHFESFFKQPTIQHKNTANTSPSLKKIYEQYGVNLDTQSFFKGDTFDLWQLGLNYLPFISHLFGNTAPFKMIPTIGIYQTERYYAYSLCSGKNSRIYSRFICLRHPAQLNYTTPHTMMHAIAMIAHDAHHLYTVKNYAPPEKLHQLQNGKTVSELISFAKRHHPALLSLSSRFHLTDSYGFYVPIH